VTTKPRLGDINPAPKRTTCTRCEEAAPLTYANVCVPCAEFYGISVPKASSSKQEPGPLPRPTVQGEEAEVESCLARVRAWEDEEVAAQRRTRGWQ
jgi:hypothetical protein